VEDKKKESKTANWSVELFGRLIIGLTLSTELFWIDDRNSQGPLGDIRHYCLLHIGRVEIEKRMYWAYELIFPFFHVSMVYLRREENQ